MEAAAAILVASAAAVVAKKVFNLIGADSLRPDRSNDWESIFGTLFEDALTPEQRQAAREENIKRLQAAKNGRITALMGPTGSGKTTTFGSMYTNCVKGWDMGILVLPSHNNASDAYDSIVGVYYAQHPGSEKFGIAGIEQNCVIFLIDQSNKNGWRKDLEAKIKGRTIDGQQPRVLVICTVNQFFNTMEYWKNNKYDMMIDEPDNTDNTSMNPTAMALCHKMKLWTTTWKTVKDRNLWNKFNALKKMYIEAGGAYNYEPRDHEIKVCIGELQRLMRPCRSRVFFSTATMPPWLLDAIAHTAIASDEISMQKPQNPRNETYLGHFDRVIGTCIKEGNVTNMYGPLRDAIVNRARILDDKRTDFSQHINKGDRKIQMRSYNSILVPLPGNHEVFNFVQKFLEPSLASCGFKAQIITPFNRKIVKSEELNENTIQIHVVPYSEMQGTNFVVSSVFITPFSRIRIEKGNRQTLSIDLLWLARVIQAIGRAGRLSACNIFYVGSKKLYDSMETENKFCAEGLKSTLLGLTAHGLHKIQLDMLEDMFMASTGTSLRQEMLQMIQDGFITILPDEHYQLTRKGLIFNLFHDNYELYMDVEQYMERTNTMTQRDMFRMLLWISLYTELTNGKNSLFELPETQGLPDSFMESRCEVHEQFGGRLDSEYMYLWGIASIIDGIIMTDEFEGKYTDLKRFRTYNYHPERHNNSIAQLIHNAHLNPKAVRNCCCTALNSLSGLQDRGILGGFTDYDVADEFSFHDFIVEKSVKDLGRGKIQIARLLEYDLLTNTAVYVDNEGYTVLVRYHLTERPACDTIGVIQSIIKPNMTNREKVALGTVTIPITLLDTREDIFDTLMDRMGKIDGMDKNFVRFIQALRDWLDSDEMTDPPVNFLETEDDILQAIFDTVIGKSKPMVLDSLTYNMLKSLINMKQTSQTMTGERRRQLYDYFNKMFNEHVRENLSKTGASMLPSKPLRIPKHGITEKALTIKYTRTKDKRAAFVPHVITSANANGDLVATRIRPGKNDAVLDDHSNWQKLNSAVPFETDSQIEDRKDLFEAVCKRVHATEDELDGFTTKDIQRRPVCPLCRMTDNHDGKISTVLVCRDIHTDFSDPTKLAQNGILMTYHTKCLEVHQKDPDFGDKCPFARGRMYDIGVHGLEMELTPEDTIHGKKMVAMDQDEKTDFIRMTLMAVYENVNKVMKLEYTQDEIEQMLPSQLNALYTDYNDELTGIQMQKELVARNENMLKLNEESRKARELEKRQKAHDQARAIQQAARKSSSPPKSGGGGKSKSGGGGKSKSGGGGKSKSGGGRKSKNGGGGKSKNGGGRKKR